MIPNRPSVNEVDRTAALLPIWVASSVDSGKRLIAVCRIADQETMADIPISVVLYVHNGEPYLSRALESILQQTHQNFELCVVDDGSTDGTSGLLARAASVDSRIRIHRQDARGRTRLHETFNKGLAMTQYDLVAIANADDIWRPDKLDRQLLEFTTDPQLDVCYHEATFIDADDRVLFGGFRRYDSPYATAPPRPWQFVAGNPIPNPTVMFRRAIVRRIGVQEVGDMHDHQFWFKATVAGCRFLGLPDRLIRYRLHEGSHSTSSARREVIRAAHRSCSAAMVERYSIDELVPELSAVAASDTDARAWAYSFIAGALWSDGAFDAAEESWKQAMRLSDDPAILFGLGLVETRRGADREGARLLLAAANGGVGYAHAVLAGGADLETIQPPTWQGREPAIAVTVEQTDREGFEHELDAHPSAFDVVLVLSAMNSEQGDPSDRLAHYIAEATSDEARVRMVSLASGSGDMEILTTAYDIVCRDNPTVADRLHLEVDIIPFEQQGSVIEAHRLDGATIAA